MTCGHSSSRLGDPIPGFFRMKREQLMSTERKSAQNFPRLPSSRCPSPPGSRGTSPRHQGCPLRLRNRPESLLHHRPQGAGNRDIFVRGRSSGSSSARGGKHVLHDVGASEGRLVAGLAGAGAGHCLSALHEVCGLDFFCQVSVGPLFVAFKTPSARFGLAKLVEDSSSARLRMLHARSGLSVPLNAPAVGTAVGEPVCV